MGKISKVENATSQKAEWQLVQLRTRLRQSLGKPLVSPCFSVGELSDIRIMFSAKFPNEKAVADSGKGKNQRAKYLKMINHGPLSGELRLKVPCSDAAIVKFFVSVGSVKEGPFECNFAEKTVHSFGQFEMDWLK